MSIFDVLNPVKDIVDAAGALIGKFVEDPNQKAQYTAQFEQLQSALTSKIIDLNAQVVDAQSKIITAEATSTSWLEKDWRPLLMLFFAVVLGFAIFNGGYDFSNRAINPQYISDAMTIVKIGVGGYVAEPVVTGAIGALKGNGNGK